MAFTQLCDQHLNFAKLSTTTKRSAMSMDKHIRYDRILLTFSTKVITR